MVGPAAALALIVLGSPSQVPLPDLAEAEPQVRDKIRQAYDTVVAQPQLATAWGTYGMILQAHECRRVAKLAYGRARRLDPGDVRWPYYRSILIQATDPASAIPLLREVLERSPNYAPAHVRLGMAYQAAGQADDAWDQYNRAVDLDATHITARLRRGQLALERGQIDRAVADLEAVLAVRPASTAALSSLAVAYQRRGHRELAAETAARIRHRHGEGFELEDPYVSEMVKESVSRTSFLLRAASLRQARRPAEALQELERGLALIPQDPQLNVMRAAIYLQQGRYEQALEAAEQARAVDEETRNLHRMRAGALIGLGRLDEAEEASQLALEADPDNPVVRRLRGELLLRRGRPEEAIEHFERAVRLAPDDTTLRFRLAGALTAVNRLEEALPHLDRIVSDRPQHAGAWGLLGSLQLRRDHHDEAISAFERALAAAVDPRMRSSIARSLALALVAAAADYAEAGRFPEAVGTMTEALRRAQEAHLPEETLEKYRRRLELYRSAKTSGAKEP